MKLLRKVCAAAVFACVIGVDHPGFGVAQEPPPDPRVLLNLDLFAGQSGDGPSNRPAGNGSSSFIDQIRTLSAMGLIGGGAGNHKPPAGADTNEAGDNQASENGNSGDGDDAGSGNILSLPRTQPEGAGQDQ